MKQRHWLALTLWLSVLALVAEGQTAPKPLAKPGAADLAQGRRLFDAQCVRCHGVGGRGGAGPSLARPRLRHAADDKALVQVLFDGIPGTPMAAAWQLNERETVQLAAYVRSLGRIPVETLTGDPGRGRALFEGKAGCAVCHIVRGVGGNTGPELTDVGARRGAAHLRESLLDPAADQPERTVPYEPGSYPAYLVVEAVRLDGQTLSGYRVNEDAFTIQIRDSEGRLHSLRRADLVRIEKKPAQSLMPSYRGILSPGEIEDLVAWLASLRGEP